MINCRLDEDRVKVSLQSKVWNLLLRCFLIKIENVGIYVEVQYSC